MTRALTNWKGGADRDARVAWLRTESEQAAADMMRLIAILAANRLNAETDAAVLTAGGAR